MKYELTHQDASGNKENSVGQISFLAFVKHATFAGIDRPFFSGLPFRYFSIFLDYSPSFFRANYFKILPELSSDPTEIAYMSNRIGRAFADYFSKKLYGAKFTHSYECAMHLKGHPIVGERPDFYCDAITKQFAVEAKGYSVKSISDTAMSKYKNQSRTGPLPVNFSAASVAYNLYNTPKIKFYDPEGENIPYDESLNLELRKLYYERVLYFILGISGSRTQSEHLDYFAYDIPYSLLPVRKILVHKKILERSWGNFEWLAAIEHKEGLDDDFYIDVDGIGVSIR